MQSQISISKNDGRSFGNSVPFHRHCCVFDIADFDDIDADGVGGGTTGTIGGVFSSSSILDDVVDRAVGIDS